MNPNRPSFLVLFLLPYAALLFHLLYELGTAGLWGEVFAARGAVRALFGLADAGGVA